MFKRFSPACFVFVCCLITVHCELVNKNVERILDLSTQLVKITTHITLENTGSGAANNFLLAFEGDTTQNLSYVHVTNKQGDEFPLAVTLAPSVHTGTFYKVQLPAALQPDAALALTVEAIFTQALKPYPTSIAQKDKQFVRYFGNHYHYSPYPTLTQTTNVVLNSKVVENYSKLKPTAQADSVINYGPYENVAPYATDELMVHFESNTPFLTVTRLLRSIEVSHWGSIAVEEHIDIVHTGATLKGPFSRYDYQKDSSSNHHSIRSYKTILPATASNIYYRDSNGNISTSQVRTRKDWIEVELRPRYPLFGGWKSSYTIGYSVPSYQYVYVTPERKYAVRMRLLDHILDDMHVAEMETSVTLPVGVTNVVAETPFATERLADSYAFKYLDARGRPVIRFRKANLVEQHIQDFTITYNWSSMNLFYEPTVVSLALLVLFLLVVVYVRLDFAIYPREHGKKE